MRTRTIAIGASVLFAGLGGVAVAAPGGPWILGGSNSSSLTTSLDAPVNGAGVQISNTSTGSSSTPLSLNAAAGHAPMKVNSKTRVTNLNADAVDGLGSSAWVRRGVPTSHDASAAGGVVDVTNTGSSNGVQGKTSASASGVYGEHIGPGGFGIAGRAGDDGNAVYGDNTGNGWAGYFEDKVHIGGILDCNGCVDGADVTGKVGDADTLDGIDSSGLMQGSGGSVGQAIAESPGQSSNLGPAMFGFLQLQYSCPGVNTNGTLFIWNRSSGFVNVFVESASTKPLYFRLAPGGPALLPATASGDMFHIQAQGSPGVMAVEAAIVHRPSLNDCHAQAQGTLTR